MLLLRVEYEPGYYVAFIRRLTKIRRETPIHVDVVAKKRTIFVMSLDDHLSASLLYAAYLKAKDKGLRADLMYARYIDEDLLPEEVRKAGERWLSKKLSKDEIELLKSRSITEHIFTRWWRWQ